MTPRSDDLKHFYDQYEAYTRQILAPSRIELKRLFAQWREPGFWTSESDESKRVALPSPLQRPPFVRIKRPESVADKIRRRTDVFPEGFDEVSFRRMNDTVGARVVVFFLSNLAQVDHQIRHRGDFEISSAYPPRAYLPPEVSSQYGLDHLHPAKKDSGYTSIHYIVRLTESAVPIEDRPWMEIQLRTLAEDLWASVEHILGYKTDAQTAFPVAEQFGLVSSHIMTIDRHLNFIYQEHRRHQQNVSYSSDTRLNSENLPAVLAGAGIPVAQFQVNFLLRVLHSFAIHTVQDLAALTPPGRRDLVENTCRSHTGQDPNTVHLVTLLALTKGATSDEERAARIRVQLDANTWWSELLGERDGKDGRSALGASPHDDPPSPPPTA